MIQYDQMFEHKLPIGHSDNISWSRDFVLYIKTIRYKNVLVWDNNLIWPDVKS